MDHFPSLISWTLALILWGNFVINSAVFFVFLVEKDMANCTFQIQALLQA